MDNTSRLALPLVAASQAQKHVTVNEALARLDAAYQLSVVSATTTTPPVAAVDGDAFVVPGAAVNEWASHDGKLAFFLNGGWEFLSPLAGWQVWVQDEARRSVYLGDTWRKDALASSPNQAHMRAEVIETDFTLLGGSGFEETGLVLPSNASVFAVTGRVQTEITGTLSDWSLGIDGAETRYGSGLGLGAGAWLRGVTSQPVTYYNPTALRLTANGGTFGGGMVRLAIHCLRFELPD